MNHLLRRRPRRGPLIIGVAAALVTMGTACSPNANDAAGFARSSLEQAGRAQVANGSCPFDISLEGVTGIGRGVGAAKDVGIQQAPGGRTDSERSTLSAMQGIVGYCTYPTPNVGDITVTVFDAHSGQSISAAVEVAGTAAGLDQQSLAAFLVTASNQGADRATNSGGLGNAAVVQLSTADHTSASLAVTSSGKNQATGATLDGIATDIATQLIGSTP